MVLSDQIINYEEFKTHLHYHVARIRIHCCRISLPVNKGQRNRQHTTRNAYRISLLTYIT